MSSGERFLVNSFKIHSGVGGKLSGLEEENKAGAVYPVFVGFRKTVCLEEDVDKMTKLCVNFY